MSEIRAVHASSALNSVQDLLHPGARQVLVWPGNAVFQHVMSVALKQGEEVQAGLGLEPNHALPARVALHRATKTYKDLSLDQASCCHVTHGDIMAFKFLWIDYEPRCYYWEFVEVVKNIVRFARAFKGA